MAVIVLGTVRLPPENLSQARAAMADMVAASRAEDGCLEYAYAEDVLQPGLIRVTEIWRDQAALDAHARAPHLSAWRQVWPALRIGDRRLVSFETASGPTDV